MNDNSEDDWRLQGQENYLKGVKLIAHEYQPVRAHVHIGKRGTKEFCKIWLEPGVEVAKNGSLTEK